jgi:hypothetical protein
MHDVAKSYTAASHTVFVTATNNGCYYTYRVLLTPENQRFRLQRGSTHTHTHTQMHRTN